MAEPVELSGAVAVTRDRLREWIDGGRYAASGRLPGERRLAAELDVGRGTVRAALQALASEGLLRPAPQSGWFVVRPPLSEPPHTLVSFTEMAARQGLEPRTAVISARCRSADLAESERLRVPPSTPVLELTRVRSLSGVPVCLDRSVVSLVRVPGLDRVDLTDASLYAEMGRLGVVASHSDLGLQARGADEETAKALFVEPGCPVLVVDELCLDSGGRPLLLGQATFRGDSYRFLATLFRARP